MAMLDALPLSLGDQLTAVARRVRLLRTARGLSFVVLLLAVVGGGTLLADACFNLPGGVRAGLFAAWLGLGLLIILFGLLLPLCRRLDTAALAAIVEEKYPDLGERLTATVELTQHRDVGHGSPTLIALLADETEAQSRHLDFPQAVPARYTFCLAGITAVVLLLVFSPALLWADRYADLARRFLLSWQTAPAASPARVAGASSPSQAVEPVELASDSPTITVTPPAYAFTIEPATVRGLADVAALQYSRVRFDCRFTRPATAAVLELTPRAGGQKSDLPQATTYPLILSTDGRSASLELPALADAAYRLVLTTEQGLRSEFGPQALKVYRDEPPVFLQVSGGDDRKAALPYERIPLAVTLADDIAVERAEIEYHVNNRSSAFESIPLQGQGTRDARGKLLFDLSGKVQEGDELQYRLRVQDNRHLPEAGLGPQITYYPAGSWRSLRVTGYASLLRQEGLLSERREISNRLESILAGLHKEIRGVYKLQQETRRQPALDWEQAEALNQLRKENEAARKELTELARDLAQTPGLRPLAEQAQRVADAELARAAEDLARAETEGKPDARNQRFVGADRELTAAAKHLEELLRLNQRLAQDRQDQLSLETAAQKQQHLADRAAELAAQDRPAKAEAEQLRQEQGEVARELQRLTEQSERVRSALTTAQAEQARQMAERATKLAQAERDLAQSPDTPPARQQELKEQASQLTQDLSRLAQQMSRSPQAQKPAQQAASSAQDAHGAMHEAQQQGRDGSSTKARQAQQRAATALERAAQQAGQAAQQLIAGVPSSPSGLPKPQAGQAVQQAQGQMSQAQSQLGQGQAKAAQASMQQAAQALQQASQQLAQPGQQAAGTSGRTGSAGGGNPDLSAFGPDLKQYDGKSWGELPGELQTKLLQDLKARYGDDYARRIKLYFEQLADTKGK
jgi:hypothetical protein